MKEYRTFSAKNVTQEDFKNVKNFTVTTFLEGSFLLDGTLPSFNLLFDGTVLLNFH